MKTRTWIVVAGIALAMVVAIVSAPAVFAQGPAGGYGPGMHRAQMIDGTPGPGMGMRGGMGPMQGRHGEMGGPQQSLVAVAADKLGMTQADLIAQLQGGKTIAQVAKDKQVALDTIVDVFVATRQARMAEAVAAGRMTQAQADAMLATMRTNVTERLSQPWSPQGNGPGASFIDQDGDGVCDHAGSGRVGGGPMRGCAQP
jgi:hypothetical protein